MEFAPRTAHVVIEGIGPLLWGKRVEDRKEGEPGEVYEKRVWKSRFHATKDGQLIIPSRALKLALEHAAGQLQMSVPGRGQKKFKSVFLCSVMVTPTDIPIIGKTVDDLVPLEMFVPSDGTSGGGKRVDKTFPLLEDWTMEPQIVLLDQAISENALTSHLEAAGEFSGLGMWRAAKGGAYGRFRVASLKITEGASFAS